MKIDYFLRFNRSTTRKPFRTTRDAFRHRVNIFESMNIVPRAAFTIVLFYFPDAGRTIWIVSDREPSTTVNINGAHKPWRIHLRMSRDELFFFFVAGCTSRLFPVFYFEFRASSRKPIIFHANIFANYCIPRFFFSSYVIILELKKKINLLTFNLPSSVKCAPPIFVLPSEKETEKIDKIDTIWLNNWNLIYD